MLSSARALVTIRPVRIHIDQDPAVFVMTAWDFLLTDPVLNNVICTNAEARVRDDLPTEPAARWFRIVAETGALAGAAMWTPPRGILLSVMPPTAAVALADELSAVHARLPSVDGPTEVTTAFRDRWTMLTGAPTRPGLTGMAFRLDEVDRPEGVPGYPREVTESDRDLVVGWLDAFGVEALPHVPAADNTVTVDRRLATGGLMWVWQDAGRPVSFAWQSRLTPVVPGDPVPRTPIVRVGAVYTPPELRGHGYASANVAALSQHALDSGALACVLYTDQANPTSNKIYEQVGYRPVGPSQEWLFGR